MTKDMKESKKVFSLLSHTIFLSALICVNLRLE